MFSLLVGIRLSVLNTLRRVSYLYLLILIIPLLIIFSIILDEFDEIHFFGDKTTDGGNDYEIYTHPRVIGHTTTGPEETIRLCKEIFLMNNNN